MKTFDIKTIPTFPFAEREKTYFIKPMNLKYGL